MKKFSLKLALVVFTPWLFTATSAQAQEVLSYSAKFVCGQINGDLDVVRGIYATAINIHNPQFRDVKYFKKAVIALPERTFPRGPISKKVQEALAPDQAIGVDCRDIRILFSGVALPTHIEGFLVVEVPEQATSPTGTNIIPELDMVGKYTARHRTGTSNDPSIYDVETLHLETVHPVRVPCIPGIPCPPP